MAGEIYTLESFDPVLNLWKQWIEALQLVRNDIQGKSSFVSLTFSLMAIQSHAKYTFKSPDGVSEGWPRSADRKESTKVINMKLCNAQVTIFVILEAWVNAYGERETHIKIPYDNGKSLLYRIC